MSAIGIEQGCRTEDFHRAIADQSPSTRLASAARVAAMGSFPLQFSLAPLPGAATQ